MKCRSQVPRGELQVADVAHERDVGVVDRDRQLRLIVERRGEVLHRFRSTPAPRRSPLRRPTSLAGPRAAAAARRRRRRARQDTFVQTWEPLLGIGGQLKPLFLERAGRNILQTRPFGASWESLAHARSCDSRLPPSRTTLRRTSRRSWDSLRSLGKRAFSLRGRSPSPASRGSDESQEPAACPAEARSAKAKSERPLRAPIGASPASVSRSRARGISAPPCRRRRPAP